MPPLGLVYVLKENSTQPPSTPYQNFTILINNSGGPYGKFLKKVQKKYRKKKNVKFFSAVPFIPDSKTPKSKKFFQALKEEGVEGLIFLERLNSQRGIATSEEQVTSYEWDKEYSTMESELVYNSVKNKHEWETKITTPELIKKEEWVTNYHPTISLTYRVSLMDVKTQKVIWNSIMGVERTVNIFRHKPEFYSYLFFLKTVGRLKKRGFIPKKL